MSGETQKILLPENLEQGQPHMGEASKKMPEIKIKRSLVNHDLDQLLVYGKRERKPFVSDAVSVVQKSKVFRNKTQLEKKKAITKIKTEVEQQGIEKEDLQFKEQLISYKDIPSHDPAHQIKLDILKYQEGEKERKRKVQQEKEAQKFQIKKEEQKFYQKVEVEIKKQIPKVINSETKKKPKKKVRITYKEQDSQQIQPFPYTNQFFSDIRSQHIQFLQDCEIIKQQAQEQEQPTTLNSRTFANCDVRYFNWNFFADRVGSFDVILIDPPWRIKGAQQNDSQFMFSNCKFSLDYNTMSNGDIESIQIQKLSKCGFIFIWILNTQLGSSLEVMNKWGYELVDVLIWVKMRKNKVFLTNGFYFMHSYEMCLIGYKSHPQMSISTVSLLSNNVLFADVRKKSQKPDELYHMIEMMFPTNKKVEIFARNNNLRFGWFSLGNELGENYDKWLLSISCDRCSTAIVPRVKRFKSKFKANFDLCEKCITEEEKEEFYAIENEVDENIIHLYRACNHCKSEPIWGNRFECTECQDMDLCQICFDQNLRLETPFHDIHHKMDIIEVPIFAQGFVVHDVKCCGCYQKPVIGICFACNVCKSFNLCQKCFFAMPDMKFKRHKIEHSMQALYDPTVRPVARKFDCFSCAKEIWEDCYMCQHCYNFFFCEDCYQNRESFKTNMATNHKYFHKFLKVF